MYQPQDIAGIYTLLASLFRQSPNQEQLDFLSNLDFGTPDESLERDPTFKAWQALKQQASQMTPSQIADEYQNLFIGIGRGEVVPYASWHLTGSLMEKPLVKLRQDLAALGYERQAGVKEPEDGIASILEVMGYLILDNHSQAPFFNQYIASWVGDLCQAIIDAPSQKFYGALSQVLRTFSEQEAARLQVNIPLFHG